VILSGALEGKLAKTTSRGVGQRKDRFTLGLSLDGEATVIVRKKRLRARGIDGLEESRTWARGIPKSSGGGGDANSRSFSWGR